MTVTLLGYLHRFLRFYFSVFSLVLVSIEKIFRGMFDHISKRVEVSQKLSTMRTRCIFISLLGAWRCRHTQFGVFDILLHTCFCQLTNTLNLIIII